MRLEKLNEYRYFGFLSYVMENSKEIRDMCLNELLDIYDYDEIITRRVNKNREEEYTQFNLILLKNGMIQEVFLMEIGGPWEDFLFVINLRNTETKVFDGDEVTVVHNLYIISDSQFNCFPEYITNDTIIRKDFDITDGKIKEADNKVLEFHKAIQLDFLDEQKIDNDLNEFMHMIKYNAPHDFESSIAEEINKTHKKYLESDEYKLDEEYVLLGIH